MLWRGHGGFIEEVASVDEIYFGNLLDDFFLLASRISTLLHLAIYSTRSDFYLTFSDLFLYSTPIT